jgi:hypothetical protein
MSHVLSPRTSYRATERANRRLVAPGPLAATFAFALVVLAYLPLRLSFPSEGLDASWQLAVNESVARGLSIGQSVVFTYGPAESIVTAFYHPATYAMVMPWALVLGVACAISLWLQCGRRALPFLIVGVIVAGTSQRQTLVLIAPLIGFLGCARLASEPCRGWRLLGASLAVMTAVIPVVAKVSVLHVSCVSIVGAVVLWAALRRYVEAAFTLGLSLVACVAVWASFGQDPRVLPEYAASAVQLSLTPGPER